MSIRSDSVCAQLVWQLYLRVVNGGKRQDDFFGGGGNWVTVTVIINILVLFLLGQPSCGILCHVAKVGFLQRAQHFMWRTKQAWHLLQHPNTSNTLQIPEDIQLYKKRLNYCSESDMNYSVTCWQLKQLNLPLLHFVKNNTYNKNKSTKRIITATWMVR